jgi:hypothetical protein
MILLRGGSSTGKTRSLFEAIHQLRRSPMILRPLGIAALRALPTARLWDRPVVVWLDELHGFLGPDGAGLSLPNLRELFTVADIPPVIVATVWPSEQEAKIVDSGGDSSETAQLFMPNQWVRTHRVPDRFSASELTAARRHRHDSRIAAALADTDEVGFTQTLAGGPELLRSYDHSASPVARQVLNAAADVRRLGHTRPLTMSLLEAVTRALWGVDHMHLDAGSFRHAFTRATQPLESSDRVRALIPLITRDGQLSGYALADYLEQHLRRARTQLPVPDGLWSALLTHTDHPDDLAALADAARNRGRYTYTESFLQKAAATAPHATTRLARWLRDRPGREAVAETVSREAASAGDTAALTALGQWLAGRPGRQAETERAYRDAAAAGEPGALSALTYWLRDQPGRDTEAEQILRAGLTATGDTADD